MFLTDDFIEKYSKQAKGIRIDNCPFPELKDEQKNAVFAYLYDMYMKLREYIPSESVFDKNDIKMESKIKKNEKDEKILRDSGP